jgi:H+/Cl- antiporter ClcA
VKQRTQSLVRLNLELAKLEAKKKAMALGVAGGLALLAAVLVVYAIGFAFASAAAGISEALPVWLSLLIVAGAILLLAAIAGLLARRFARKASPPKPAQAIEEAERTVEALRSHV